MKTRKIYCCECAKDVNAKLITGKEAYPHRRDLYHLPFWRCDTCNNFTGCHYKTKNRTRPLGVIPTAEIKKARQKIHHILDPLWMSGKYERDELYSELSKALGWDYHTAELRTMEQVVQVLKELENF